MGIIDKIKDTTEKVTEKLAHQSEDDPDTRQRGREGQIAGSTGDFVNQGADGSGDSDTNVTDADESERTREEGVGLSAPVMTPNMDASGKIQPF